MAITLPQGTPRLVIADDSEAILRVVTRFLANRFDLVGICRDGRAAVQTAMELAPDAILLDIRMPFIDGIKVARQLRAASLGSKIIMLTSMEDTSCVDSAMAAGAYGFVFKRKMATDLIKAIDTVLGGGNFISSDCELRRDPELTLNFV